MKSRDREKIPLPNNPYNIYKEEKGDKTYYKAPFPNYIAKILGKDPEDFAEKHQIKISVDKEKQKIELKLQEKQQK